MVSRSGYLIVVAMVLLTMIIVGCVTAQDIPDVEATVVVMLEEEKEKSLPTPLSTEVRLDEIKAKTFATPTPLPQPTASNEPLKTMIDSKEVIQIPTITPTPRPGATPSPTFTPTPTATPTPVPSHWISSGGSTGPLVSLNDSTDALVIAHNPLESSIVMSSEYGEGKVLAFGHEGFLINIVSSLGDLRGSDSATTGNTEFDNDDFLMEAINWFGSPVYRDVKITTNHNEFAAWHELEAFRDVLVQMGYIPSLIEGEITSSELSDTGILILGNAWGEINDNEISAVHNFVEAGGGLIMAGLGWSWLSYADDPNWTTALSDKPGEEPTLENYPMNKVAKAFGIQWADGVVYDNITDSQSIFLAYDLEEKLSQSASSKPERTPTPTPTPRSIPTPEPVSVLTYVEMKKDGVGGVDGLDGAKSVTVSPDGNHVYATGWAENAIAVFSRNSSTGKLTYVEMKKNGVGEVRGLDGVKSVIVSLDGKHVYTAAENESAVAVFSRNSSTGALTHVEMKQDGVGGVDGLGGAQSVTVSPDGNHVYAASDYDHAIAVFSRNSSTSTDTSQYPDILTVVDLGTRGYGGSYDINGSYSGQPMWTNFSCGNPGKYEHCHIFLSPDKVVSSTGTWVIQPVTPTDEWNAGGYFDCPGLPWGSCSPGWEFAEITVSKASGEQSLTEALTYVEMKKDGVGGIDGLDGAKLVTVSPDGNHVYAAAENDDAVAVFSRNSSTGALTYVEMKKDGVGGVDGLDGAQSVTVSPDGNHVYATSYNENAIAVFSRNSSTGKLTYVEMKKNGVGEVRGLDEVKSVVVSLDGKHVYTAAENESAIAVFSRNLSTGELTYVEMKQDGVGGVDGLDNALSITVSPDGKHVYSAGQGDDAVAVFSMNSSTSIPTPTPTPTPTPSPTPSPTPTPTPSPTPTPTPSPEPEYLYVGSTVEGYLAATDKHYWDFLIMEGQRIFVEAETDWGVSLDTYLELWGPEEEGTRVLLASNDNGPLAEVDNSRDPLIDFEILETGTHRVMVGPNPDMPSYSDNGGNYKLSVVVVEDHGYLEMGTPVDEYLLTFEKHYWHFNGVAGQYIVIEAVSGAPGFGAAQLDTYIELHGPGWDGARQLLARNDDGFYTDVSYRYDSIINFEILETGPHTVVMSPPVLENKTDGFGDKTGRQGDYRLSVQEAPE